MVANIVLHNELSPGREANCVSARPAIDVVKVLFVETGQETARTDSIQKVISQIMLFIYNLSNCLHHCIRLIRPDAHA